LEVARQRCPARQVAVISFLDELLGIRRRQVDMREALIGLDFGQHGAEFFLGERHGVTVDDAALVANDEADQHQP